jgi:hypothetical protein
MGRRPLPTKVWAAAALGLLLAACAGPYSLTRVVDPAQGLTVAEGVRVVARAMQVVGYFPTQQTDVSGQVVGERSRKDSWGMDVMTLTIEARLSPIGAGGMQMQATCSVSKNIAYTDELDDECKKFRAAFDRLLGERRSAVRTAPGVAPARPVAPASAPAPKAEKPKAYSL